MPNHDFRRGSANSANDFALVRAVAGARTDCACVFYPSGVDDGLDVARSPPLLHMLRQATKALSILQNARLRSVDACGEWNRTRGFFQIVDQGSPARPGPTILLARLHGSLDNDRPNDPALDRDS